MPVIILSRQNAGCDRMVTTQGGWEHFMSHRRQNFMACPPKLCTVCISRCQLCSNLCPAMETALIVPAPRGARSAPQPGRMGPARPDVHGWHVVSSMCAAAICQLGMEASGARMGSIRKCGPWLKLAKEAIMGRSQMRQRSPRTTTINGTTGRGAWDAFEYRANVRTHPHAISA